METTVRPSDNTPVFLVAAARSGGTLTYSMLLATDVFPIYRAEVKIPEASRKYGPLHRERNYERFLAAFVNSRQFHRSGLSEDDLRRKTEGAGDYLEFMRIFMDEVARAQGKERWMAKVTPLDVPKLRERFPSGRFLHLVRDGRDVSLSRFKLGWTPEWITDRTRALVWEAKKWEELVERAEQMGETLGERFRTVRYEDLVRKLDETLETIATFADVHLDRSVLKNRPVGALENPNTAFGADWNGLSDRAVQRWKTQMGSREVAALDWAVGPTLERFDYPLGSNGSDQKPDLLIRITGGFARPTYVVKEWLKEATPLGRYSNTPLEVGLE